MTQEPPSEDVVLRLREIWLEATPDTIGADLRRAKEIAECAPPSEREKATRYLDAIRRLERWLHDM